MLHCKMYSVESVRSSSLQLEATLPGADTNGLKCRHAVGKSHSNDLVWCRTLHRLQLIRERPLGPKVQKMPCLKEAIPNHPLSKGIDLKSLELERYGAPSLVPPLVLCQRPLLHSLKCPIPVLLLRESSKWATTALVEANLPNGGLS